MSAQIVDVTSASAVLSLFGPNARRILQSITQADISNAAHPFATARHIGIAGCPVLAMRISYVGESGWELHIPTEYALTVYAALHKAGAAHGLRNAGYRAIETLRLEKGYRAWSSDIGPDHTPDEAGLGWAVKMDTGIDFKGRSAIAAQRETGIKKMLATFTTDSSTILYGRETIYRNNERCGWLSSGGYGHTVKQSIGMGYVRSDNTIDQEYVLRGDYELEVATVRVPAEVSLSPLYDPQMLNMKG